MRLMEEREVEPDIIRNIGDMTFRQFFFRCQGGWKDRIFCEWSYHSHECLWEIEIISIQKAQI